MAGNAAGVTALTAALTTAGAILVWIVTGRAQAGAAKQDLVASATEAITRSALAIAEARLTEIHDCQAELARLEDEVAAAEVKVDALQAQVLELRLELARIAGWAPTGDAPHS